MYIKNFTEFVRDTKFENVNEKKIIKTLDLSIIEDIKDIKYIIDNIKTKYIEVYLDYHLLFYDDSKKILLELLKYKKISKEIKNKYIHLLNASNFDLI
jgi:hypothetical protein